MSKTLGGGGLKEGVPQSGGSGVGRVEQSQMCVIEAPSVRKFKVVSDEIGQAKIASKRAGWLKKNDGVRRPWLGGIENCRLGLLTSWHKGKPFFELRSTAWKKEGGAKVTQRPAFLPKLQLSCLADNLFVPCPSKLNCKERLLPR